MSTGAVSPATVPGRDAAAELEDLRAGMAQASALIPLVGPAVAFAKNRRYGFARREAAKAFNGQLATILAAATLAPFAPVWGSTGVHLHVVVGIVMVVLGGAAHGLLGTWHAMQGRDWVSPLSRVIRVRVLPEGEPDPVRSTEQELR